VERAKADGTWDAAYGGAATREVPDDLKRAHSANLGVSKASPRLDNANRYSVLYRVTAALRSDARRLRIARLWIPSECHKPDICSPTQIPHHLKVAGNDHACAHARCRYLPDASPTSDRSADRPLSCGYSPQRPLVGVRRRPWVY
jgi:hypothetical protein